MSEKDMSRKIKSRHHFLITHEALVKYARISFILLMLEIFYAFYYSNFLQVFGTGLLILVSAAFLILIKETPAIFGLLWERGIISGRNRGIDRNAVELKNEYERFNKNFSDAMSRPVQITLAGLFMLVVLTRAPFRFGGVENAIEIILKYPVGWLPFLFIEGFSGFVFGLIVWRIFVIGIWISQLGSKFRISPILGHPDESGGLRPIGNVCLKIGIICSLLPIAAGTLLLFNLLPLRLINWTIAGFISTIPLPFIGFFLPIWSIHKAMKEAKDIIELRINKIDSYIHSNISDVLENFLEMEAGEIQEKLNKVEYFRKIYQDGKKFPTWPFNTRMLLRFFGSQVIPFLALVKSLGELFSVKLPF